MSNCFLHKRQNIAPVVLKLMEQGFSHPKSTGKMDINRYQQYYILDEENMPWTPLNSIQNLPTLLPTQKKQRFSFTSQHWPLPPSKTSYKCPSPNRYLCHIQIYHPSSIQSIDGPRYHLWEVREIRHFAQSSILKLLQGLFCWWHGFV